MLPTNVAAPVPRSMVYSAEAKPSGAVKVAYAMPVTPEMSKPTQSELSTPSEPISVTVPVFGDGVPSMPPIPSSRSVPLSIAYSVVKVPMSVSLRS